MELILQPTVVESQQLIVLSNPFSICLMDSKKLKREFSIRLHEICDGMGVQPVPGRQTALAKIFTISQEAARKWLEGESIPTFERQDQICEWAKVNYEWLMRGKGPKYIDSSLYTTDDPQIIHVCLQMEGMSSVGKTESVSRVDGVAQLIEKIKHNGTQ